MTRAEPTVWTTPKTLGRVLVAAAGVSIFFIAAKTMDPGNSSASTALPLGPAHTAEITTETPEFTSLGRYQGVDHAVYIVATPEGPRYTITDASGNILESLLEEFEVYSALESHGIEIGQPADDSTLLMLADDPNSLHGILD